MLLGLLIIYFIGKWFYKLAEKHQQNKWLYAILGVVVYYAMTILGGLVVFLILMTAGIDERFEAPNIIAGLSGIPIGLLSMWGFHVILRKNWEANPKNAQSELLDNTEI